MNMTSKTNYNSAEDNADKKPSGELCLFSLRIRPIESIHAELNTLLASVDKLSETFINVDQLPCVGTIAELILSDDQGQFFVLDMTKSQISVRHLSHGADHENVKSRSSLDKQSASKNIPPNDPKNYSFSSIHGMDHIQQEFIASAADALARSFFQSLADYKAIGPNLLSPGGVITTVGSIILQEQGLRLLGSMLGRLLGKVDDASSLEKQLAAKFGPILLMKAQALIASIVHSPPTEIFNEFEQFFRGIKSQANVPLGKAESGIFNILIESKPALRYGDICTDKAYPDSGPCKEGNPAILFNGRPAVGKGHLVKGTKIPLEPKELATTVFMSLPPPPQSAGPIPLNAQNQANKQIGDKCTPADQEALSESMEGNIHRPLTCRNGVVARPDGWKPPEWLSKILGIENIASSEQAQAGIENWSLLWGAIQLGSPQQPGAGTLGSWWIPDKIFGYDMSSYYLYHDRTFSDDRNLSQLGTILETELLSYAAGMAGQTDPGRWILQMIYSAATTTAGICFGIANSVTGSKTSN